MNVHEMENGTWKSKRQKNHLDVLVEPFNHLAPEMHPRLEAEVTDVARFLGVKTTLHVMTPP